MTETTTDTAVTTDAPAAPEAAPQVAETSDASPAAPEATPFQPEASGLGGDADVDAESAKLEALGAPEGDYSTDGIEMPEGVTLDEGVTGKLGEVCRKLDLSQAAFSSIVKEMTPVLQERQAKQLAQVKAAFLRDLASDPELGGANRKTTMQKANRAYAKFVDADTRKLLEASGLNCHPGMVRLFKRIADQISDDAVVSGAASSGKKDPLAGFYDNSNMK
jgi:hypothetical protein